MKCFLFFILCCSTFGLLAQKEPGDVNWDDKYLEDQFYVGLSYNLLLDRPEGVTQQNLSYGLQAGFVKDIPVNSRRNVAIGIGLGYAVNSYYSNLFVRQNADGFEYSLLGGDDSFKRNKIETHLLEFPLEFRWRNSNATDYKFWRIYTGVKLGYVVGSRSKFVSDIEKISFYNTDTRNFHYGLTLNFGYNTFNFHAYYSLNNLFEDGLETVDGDPVKVTPLRIGIIFYIL